MLTFTDNFCKNNSSIHDSDEDSSDLEKRSHRDKDRDASKSKKKHKKHKKHKKSKKYDGEERERISSKKHKKHRRRSNEEYSPDLNSDVSPTKAKNSLSSASTATAVAGCGGGGGPTSGKFDTAPMTTATSTLNSKFTEIMKSNGHVVVAKAPINKFINTNDNGNGNGNGNSSGNGTENVKTNNTTKIPTDPNKLVEFITKSLDPNTSTQVVSSGSESDSVHDVDSPDVAVIEEDDLNLEELMRQKALLQARLGGFAISEDESETTNTPKQSTATPDIIKDKSKMIREKSSIVDKTKLKRLSIEPVVNDVILLDDSSNDIPDKQSPPRKKQRNSRSRSNERSNKLDSNRDRSSGNSRDTRDIRDNNKSTKNRRSDVDNRYKEDLRREINRDRDKERNRTSPKISTQKYQSSSIDMKPKANDKMKIPPSTSTSVRNRGEVSKRTNILS